MILDEDKDIKIIELSQLPNSQGVNMQNCLVSCQLSRSTVEEQIERLAGSHYGLCHCAFSEGVFKKESNQGM